MKKINQQKIIIREKIRLLKDSYSYHEKRMLSMMVIDKLEQDTDFLEAQKVLAYWSLEDEVDTKEFIKKWAQAKEIYLPVVVEDELELRLFTTTNNMKVEPRYGIFEPLGKAFTQWSTIDFAIIPGVAFDMQMNRLGRGKGFYDRLLPQLNAIKVGICFPFQVVDEVAVNDNDIPMDKLYY